jgi:hypothetical protein
MLCALDKVKNNILFVGNACPSARHFVTRIFGQIFFILEIFAEFDMTYLSITLVGHFDFLPY